MCNMRIANKWCDAEQEAITRQWPYTEICFIRKRCIKFQTHWFSMAGIIAMNAAKNGKSSESSTVSSETVAVKAVRRRPRFAF